MSGGRRAPVEDFWENRVLGVTGDIHDQGKLRWELVGCLGMAWVVCWLSICKGVKSSGKVTFVFKFLFKRKILNFFFEFRSHFIEKVVKFLTKYRNFANKKVTEC